MRFVKVLLICLSLLTTISFSFIPVNALDVTFNMPHSKPFAGDNAGYINIMFKVNGKYNLRTIAWFWQPADNTNQGKSVHSFVDIDVTSTSVKLEFRKPTTVAACELTYYEMGPTWYSVGETNGAYTSNTTKNYTVDSGGSIVLVEAFGNIGHFDDSFGAATDGLIINWNDTITNNSLLSDILSGIIDQNSFSQQIIISINNVKSTLSTVGSNIVSGINDMRTSIVNKFDEYFSSNQTTDNDNSNSYLNNAIQDYEQVESELVGNFSNSISSLDTDINLFNVSDFTNTASFVSDQLTNIFNSDTNIQNMIMFSLIIGFSLVLIGIGVRR